MIKAIIFDLDGVLVDACEWHYQALNEALKSVAGTEINMDEHVTTFNGLPTRQKLEILTAQGRIGQDCHDKVWDEKQRLTESVIKQNASVDHDKKQMHLRLAVEGYVLGCVTNSIRRTANLMLEKTGQMEHLALVITNEDVISPKPSPEGYVQAMDNFGVLPQETLIVEDSDKGYLAAMKSGAHVLRVKNATHVNLTAVLSKIKSVGMEDT